MLSADFLRFDSIVYVANNINKMHVYVCTAIKINYQMQWANFNSVTYLMLYYYPRDVTVYDTTKHTKRHKAATQRPLFF